MQEEAGGSAAKAGAVETSILSRRAFLRSAAVLIGTAAAATAPGALVEDAAAAAAGPSVRRIRTSCRGCGKYECGTFVTVEDGRVVKIEGDASYPGSLGNCCAKSQSSIQAAYHPDRLLYPMKRTNPKGEDPGWVRITWDEAYQMILEGFGKASQQYGGQTMFATMGTSRVYAMNVMNIAAPLGAQNLVGAAQICKGPRTALHRATDGGELYFNENTIAPKVCVQWGSGIEVSNYDDAGRVIIDNVHRATKYINIDSRMSNLAKEADYWLAPRPGTDAAIALAWQRIIVDRKLYDSLYCQRWTNCAFLVAPDAPRTEWTRTVEQYHMGMGGDQYVNTILLTEDQVVEGGSPMRFMAWDKLNERLTWLDSETGLWEGETFRPKYVPGSEDYIKESGMWDLYEWEEAKGHFMDESEVRPGMTPLWVNDLSEFDPPKELALEGTYEVTLLDGTIVAATPVLRYYYQNILDEWTCERAEEVTGVKASLIEEACVTYATRVDPDSGYGNGGINYAVTHEHTGNAIRVNHAIQAIDVLLGNTDIPGGHRGPSRPPVFNETQMGNFEGPSFCAQGGPSSSPDTAANGEGASDGAGAAVVDGSSSADDADAPHLRTFPLLGSADATAVYHAAATGDPFPMKAAASTASGVMVQSNILEAWEGVKNLDFYFNMNLWHDPISDLADVLLPAAHWLEVECPRTSQGAGGFYGALIKCKELPGECKWDIDIMVEIYKAAGIPYYGPGTDNPEYEPWQIEGYPQQNITIKYLNQTWDEYKENFEKNGWTDSRKTNRNGFGSARRYETGWFRPHFDGIPGFLTPSTRNELWLLDFEAQMDDESGLDWALPTFVWPKSNPVENSWHEEQMDNPDRSATTGNPNADKYADYTPQHYPYVLSTGRRIPVYFHSEHRQLPWCREVWPVPVLEVNPLDAEQLGLQTGDWAWVETPFGKIRQCVDVNASVAPGRMNAEHSWWFPEMKLRPGKGFDLCGCNCLVDSYAQCEAMGSPQLRGYLVNVYKATPDNSPFGNPVPCDDDGTPIITSADDERLKEWAPDYELGKGI